MPRHKTPETAKRALKAKGWTQPEAADAIGVRFEHVNRVLNGHRKSERVLKALDALAPKSAIPTEEVADV